MNLPVLCSYVSVISEWKCRPVAHLTLFPVANEDSCVKEKKKKK